MRFTIYQESRTGKRNDNQDRIAHCYSRDALLMLVADGMGGHLHGELAAHIAARHVVQAFQREARPALPDPGLFLSRALAGAHHAIVDDALDRALPEAPRTTIVACVIQDGAAHWAHAGDSRLYLLRRGHVVTRTRDHSRTQLLVDQGILTPAEADSHPARNRLYSCLGGSHAPQIEHSARTPLRDGDIIALCSDGVWGPAGDDALVSGLTGGPLSRCVPQLLKQAELAAGNSADNLSIVAMCWHADNASQATMADAISTRTMALDDNTTRLDTSSMGADASGELDNDDEIERAIREINDTIKKLDKR
ncbi:PP2C family serine/threonine-protein phosphatase [Thauera sp.]|uniref:PP2C family protein-serine/threonine phosphatase n=1 Tax=Thauera sp. TaxID=1905334 RepID=UPI00258FFA66|nr:PP2C family serine/threonine-protein phosphatase [Thauera sp.]